MLERPLRGRPFRKLLRQLRHPHLLVHDPTVRMLREVFKTESCREALVRLVEVTLGDEGANQRLHEIIVRCDIQGQTASAAAANMHLSPRQFFRCRAEAIDALAVAVEQLEVNFRRALPSDAAVYCARCRRELLDTGMGEVS